MVQCRFKKNCEFEKIKDYFQSNELYFPKDIWTSLILPFLEPTHFWRQQHLEDGDADESELLNSCICFLCCQKNADLEFYDYIELPDDFRVLIPCQMHNINPARILFATDRQYFRYETFQDLILQENWSSKLAAHPKTIPCFWLKTY